MSLLKKLIIAASVAGLVACGGDGDESSDAYLRVLHASPDAPAVDIYVNNERQLSDIAYQDGTGYLRLPEGNANLELRLTGTDTVAASYSGTFSSNSYYAALAVNEVSDLEINVINETPVVTDGSQDLRIFHAAGSAGSVDVYITESEASISSPSVDNVGYLGNSVISDVRNGDYRIRITPGDSADVVFDSGKIRIDEEAMVVAVDSSQGRSPVSLLVWAGPVATPIVDNSSELRIVQGLDAIPVDVYINEELVKEDFAYKMVSDYEVYEPKDLSIVVVEANGAVKDASTGLQTTISLARGESYTVVIGGSDANLNEAFLTDLTDVRIAEDKTLGYVRLVNASVSPDMRSSDVRIFKASGGFTAPEGEDPSSEDFVDENFSKGEDTDYIPRQPETYTISIVANTTTSPDIVPGLSSVPVGAGDMKTFVIIGDELANLEALPLEDKRTD